MSFSTCGTTIPESVVYTGGEESVVLLFQTDSELAETGFVLSYTMCEALCKSFSKYAPLYTHNVKSTYHNPFLSW